MTATTVGTGFRNISIPRSELTFWDTFVRNEQYAGIGQRVAALINRATVGGDGIGLPIIAGLWSLHNGQGGTIPAWTAGSLMQEIQNYVDNGVEDTVARDILLRIKEDFVQIMNTAQVNHDNNREVSYLGVQGNDLYSVDLSALDYDSWDEELGDVPYGDTLLRITTIVMSGPRTYTSRDFVKGILFLHRRYQFTIDQLYGYLDGLLQNDQVYQGVKALAEIVKTNLNNILVINNQRENNMETSAPVQSDTQSPEASAPQGPDQVLDLRTVRVTNSRVQRWVDELRGRGGIEQLWADIIRPKLWHHLASDSPTYFSMDGVAVLFALRELHMTPDTIKDGISGMLDIENVVIRAYQRAIRNSIHELLDNPVAVGNAEIGPSGYDYMSGSVAENNETRENANNENPATPVPQPTLRAEVTCVPAEEGFASNGQNLENALQNLLNRGLKPMTVLEDSASEGFYICSIENVPT